MQKTFDVKRMVLASMMVALCVVLPIAFHAVPNGGATFLPMHIPILLCGMLCAVACYLTVALVSNAVVAFVACILTGLVTSMLWPGTLIMMEEKLPGVGVAAFALMASGGDLGASVAPQLMGIVVDNVKNSTMGADLAQKWGLTAEQVGMKAGMLVTALFPLLGVVVLLIAMRYFKKNKAAEALPQN